MKPFTTFRRWSETRWSALPPTRSGLISLLALSAVLTGCNVIPAAQTDPTKFYILSASAGQPTEAAPAGAQKKVRLGIRTIEVATYLKSPEIVVRSGSNEVRMQDYARWAEPIQAGVTRLLREQLAGGANVARVDLQPFPLDQPRDYDVAITILHCEGATGGAEGRGARFEASIRITTASMTPELVARKIYTSPPAGWDGQNFDKLAQLLSADVLGLGAAVLEMVPQN